MVPLYIEMDGPARFRKIICLINHVLKETNCYVSPDGNIYQRDGDTYTVLTTIDIFIGMFVVPGCNCSFSIAQAIADNASKLSVLLTSPFQRIVHNRYPMIYMKDNDDLQRLAKEVRCSVKKAKSLTIKVSLCEP